MKDNEQKTPMQCIREEILRNKEFFLLNFINDIPGEEELLWESESRDSWGFCDTEFPGELGNNKE